MSKRFPVFVVFLALVLIAPGALAVLNIKITRGVEGALPIAVVPFGWESASGEAAPANIAGIVAADLQRSGRFSPLPDADQPASPHDGASVNFRNWRLIGTDFLVVGSLSRQPVEGYILKFQVFDVYKGLQLIGYSIPAHADELRYKAHQISDLIYEKLTGQKGAFTTRIAYITVIDAQGDNPRHTLQIADADGFNPQAVVESDQPLMSPTWSPDGNRLAYVSFEEGAPAVWLQQVKSGERKKVSLAESSTSAPAWSPDSRTLAVAVAKGGNTDIYTLGLVTGNWARLTHNTAIDTEPTWSPDGQSIVFTSDRGGRPQIYRMPATGGRARRITFEGDYNARPAYSPDGKQLAMVHGSSGRYRIAVLDLESSLFQVLTSAQLDESPSFAPNGAMIIYATQAADGAELAAVSVDGRVKQRLALPGSDVREPAWSPFK